MARLMAKAEAMVMSMSHDMNLVYLRAGNMMHARRSLAHSGQLAHGSSDYHQEEQHHRQPALPARHFVIGIFAIRHHQEE